MFRGTHGIVWEKNCVLPKNGTERLSKQFSSQRLHLNQAAESGNERAASLASPERNSVNKTVCFAVLTLVMLAMFSVPAHADTMGTLTLIGCGGGDLGCPNATYTFNVSNTSASLTIHINGAVTAGVNDHISGVDLGFTPSSNISSLSLVGNPGGTWTATTGSLSNGGCGDNGGAFICASSSTGGVAIAQGGTYTWTWNYTLASGATIADVGSIHIGANYDPANGLIVSQTGATTQVPEPGTLGLLTTALVGLIIAGRRRLT
jgi:hypothetical protein